jgi:hypothetical protein
MGVPGIRGAGLERNLMRLITNAVVLSSLLVAAASMAGTGGTPAAGAGSAAGSAAAGSGSSTTTASTGGEGMGSSSGNTPAEQTDLAAVKPEDMPTDVRMRRLEQKTQALKERAWQLKARVQMLKEQMLGGGVGASALITHGNEMGSSFHLISLTYSLDGTQVFVRTDDGGESLYKSKSFDIFNGPIAPGNHTISAVATYRGNGYGVFEYLNKFTFTAKGASSFVAGEGKISKVECRGFEKGGANTPMEKRAAVECKVTEMQPEKAPEAPAASTPGTTPMPAPTTTGK